MTYNDKGICMLFDDEEFSPYLVYGSQNDDLTREQSIEFVENYCPNGIVIQ